MLSNTDQLFAYLGSLGYTGTINDRLYAYLRSVAHRDGSIDDLLFQVLGELGYTGGLSNRIASFERNSSWCLPTEVFDFTRGVLPPGLTYTNSSTTRTYFGADGLLKTAVANEPIFEYDPVTRALLGMRWEMEQRTNLLLQSGDFTQSAWAFLGATKTGGQSDSRGGNSAVLLSGPSTSPSTQSVITSASGAHTYRIVAKGVAGTSTVTFFVRNGTTEISDVVGVVNPLTGQIISGAGWTSRQLANGFYEYKFTTTIAITAGNIVRCYFGAGSFVASGWNLIVDYAQLEAGASASSYIPTTSAAVIRQPDVLTATSISPWYNQSEGTVVFEGIQTAIRQSTLWQFDGGSDASRLLAYTTNSATPSLISRADVSSVNQATITSANAAAISSVFKHAMVYKVNDFAGCLNGVAVGIDTSGTIPTVTGLRFGNVFSGAAPFIGYARRFSYYPRRLPDAQIQGMSRV